MNTPALKGRITGKQLRNSIRLGAFALVFFSAIALILTQRLFVSSLLLMIACVVAWFYPKKQSNERFWEIASLLYLVFFLFDIFRFSATLAPALVHLFVFILINKLFNLRTTRDYYQLYLLTFLCMLAASSLNIEIEMFYLILTYIVLFLWNMVAMTLLREWQRQESEPLFPFSLFHPYLWAGILISAVLAFAFALGIFFILPRIQLGFFSNMKSQKLQHVSGFSQNVSLGDISSIGDNAGLAMRVRVTSSEPIRDHRFYWRGMALDHYDGKSWTTANQATRFLNEDSFSYFYSGNYLGDPRLLVKQEFYLEPIDTRVIFGQDRIVRIHGPFTAITRDANQTLTGLTRLTHYEVFSRINEFSSARVVKDEPIPENIKTYYLQLPQLSSEFHALSASLAGKSQGVVDRILSVKTYLSANYAYSTNSLPQDQVDPISEFLFRKKSGSCEYFATSMALLLRDMGVPSRLATGYTEGEYNELGDFYMVRQTDAHAWVEVYLNGQWYMVDPSPRAEEATRSFFNFGKFLESVSFFWDRYILIFSAQDQLDTISAAQDRYYQIRKSVKNVNDTLPALIVSKIKALWRQNRLPIVTAAVLIAILFLFVTWYMRQRKLRRIINSPVLFYQRTLEILLAKGFSRSPEMTPSEFIESIRKKIPQNFEEDLSHLTVLFYRARFGNHNLSEAETVAVRDSLSRLEKL